MDILRKTTSSSSRNKNATASSDLNKLTISAPLGDFRHMAHIGRDGADFGKEHIFTNSTASKSSRTKSTTSAFDGSAFTSQHESPIIKTSIPVSKAVEVMKKQTTNPHYPSSINDSLSDLVGNTSDDNSNHYKVHYTQYSSNDHDTFDDLDEKGEGDATSLLGDVLAVMDLPKYCNLPGNLGFTKSITTESTCSKDHTSSQFQTTSSDRSYSTNEKDQDQSSSLNVKYKNEVSNDTVVVNPQYQVESEEEEEIVQFTTDMLEEAKIFQTSSTSASTTINKSTTTTSPKTRPVQLIDSDDEDEIAL